MDIAQSLLDYIRSNDVTIQESCDKVTKAIYWEQNWLFSILIYHPLLVLSYIHLCIRFWLPTKKSFYLWSPLTSSLMCWVRQ